MSDFNKSYRIRTEVGKDTEVHVNLKRDYDVLELMSLKINQENIMYKQLLITLQIEDKMVYF